MGFRARPHVMEGKNSLTGNSEINEEPNSCGVSILVLSLPNSRDGGKGRCDLKSCTCSLRACLSFLVLPPTRVCVCGGGVKREVGCVCACLYLSVCGLYLFLSVLSREAPGTELGPLMVAD